MIEGATEELILVIGHESIFTDKLAEQLRAAQEPGVDVVVGTVDEELRAEIRDALPSIEVFVSGVDWLSHTVGHKSVKNFAAPGGEYLEIGVSDGISRRFRATPPRSAGCCWPTARRYW